MPILRNSNLNQALYSVTTAYLARGWSVIPLKNKVAAVPWKAFQRDLPQQSDLKTWFATGHHTSAGIITGRVSQLLVLDFDREGLAFAFEAACQALAHTRWVQTKRSYHLYFHIPDDLECHLNHAPGIDVQWEGRYVVAAGSQVGNHVYTVIRNAEPRTLSAADLVTIAAFLAEQGATNPARKGHKTVTAQHHSVPNSHPNAQNLLIGMQHHLTHRNLNQSRNNTLFRLACVARDHGCTQQQVSRALVETYTYLPTPVDHHRETPDKRRQQAKKTIDSAFSRPPRPIQHHHEPVGLSNQLREAMFSRKWTFLVRTLEGLRLKGIGPGDQISKAEAVELLNGVVGRDSIYNAMNACLEDGKYVFERTKIPPDNPPKALASHLGHKPDTQCIVSTRKKSGISLISNRPTTYFVMPGNDELAAKFGVVTSNLSDEITLDDLKSAKTTRKAYHSRFIQRRPGQYRLDFLGRRLGITARTIQSYHTETPEIQIQAMYSLKSVHWFNLEQIIPDEVLAGTFLTDEQGKRYPPLRQIARKLLAKGHKVTLQRREANYYWYIEDDGRPLFQRMAAHQPPPSRQYWPRTWEQPAQGIKRAASAPQKRPKMPVSVPQRDKRVHSRPTPPCESALNTAQEQMAQRLFTEMNRMTGNEPDHQLTLANAQRIVAKYGVAAVKRTLWIVQQRDNVRKPVGLLVTILRSDSRVRSF